MPTNAQIDDAVAWEVTAIPESKHYRSGKLQPTIRERFATKTEADDRKHQLQKNGFVATATPIFISKKTREARNRARQTAPFGAFCADWTLKQ